MVERSDIGMPLPRVTGFLFSGKHTELLEKAERITVPAGDIEIAAQGVMIELREEPI